MNEHNEKNWYLFTFDVALAGGDDEELDELDIAKEIKRLNKAGMQAEQVSFSEIECTKWFQAKNLEDAKGVAKHISEFLQENGWNSADIFTVYKADKIFTEEDV